MAKVNVLFVVAPRRRGDELLRKVQAIDPHAFITIDPINKAIGGYMAAPRARDERSESELKEGRYSPSATVVSFSAGSGSGGKPKSASTCSASFAKSDMIRM
jgi:hypothetical protein